MSNLNENKPASVVTVAHEQDAFPPSGLNPTGGAWIVRVHGVAVDAYRTEDEARARAHELDAIPY